MSNEERLDWLCRLRSYIPIYIPRNKAQFEEALSEEIKALSEGEWINVSERLPETNRWVLVSVESSSGNHYVEIMRIDKYKGLWTDNIDYYAEIVKAWQPLPEPFMRGKADE